MPKVSQRSREYVRNRVQEHMDGWVSIYRWADVEFDENTGIISYGTRTPYYQGKARIWQVNDGDVVVAGEANITTLMTNISIPWDATVPHKDDIVIVDRNIPDPSIIGFQFRVMFIDAGGYIGGARRMRCVSFSESASWMPQ